MTNMRPPCEATMSRRSGAIKRGRLAFRLARAAFFRALGRVLVEPRAQALLGDLDHEILVGEPRLTAEPRLGTDLERLVHDVVLFVGDLGQRVDALVDPDVARRAREVAAARVPDARAALLRRIEDRH